MRTYKVSRDPAFAAKVTDVVALYLHPPEHAIVLSVDEKTSIQALQRTQPPLPLRTGRAVRHPHDYRRHGVIDLFAALEVATGNVTHRFSPTHTATDFLRFMKKVARTYPDHTLHVVLDNSSTHDTDDVRAWLAAHPRIHFHYTPTSASWLNQIEGFFGILTKQSLAVTDFPSAQALQDHLVAYLRAWTGTRRPLSGPSRRARSSGRTSACLIASQRRCTSDCSLPIPPSDACRQSGGPEGRKLEPGDELAAASQSVATRSLTVREGARR